MNYRHAYHAGNFADVLKHAVMALVIEHLKLKPAPFRVIDTHAGIGLYDLASVEAQKTGEWRAGIGRLLGAQALPAEVEALLAPYLGIVRSFNAGDGIMRYPGSPLIARRLMRPDDQLIANELHAEDVAGLRWVMASEPASKVLELDGYVALRALLPPKERRGLVLIDPPFEDGDEFATLAAAVADAMRRFATGTVLIWYPIKDIDTVAAFHQSIAGLRIAKVLVAELYLRAPRRVDVLNGCGLVIINPPYTLAGQLQRLLPILSRLLQQDAGATERLLALPPAPE